MEFFIVLLTALFFAIDLMLPLGVAGGVPYVAVVLVSFWSARRELPFFLAVLCTGLTLAGYVLSPSGGEQWKVVSNRLLAIFAIWVTATLTYMRQRSEMMRFKSDLKIRALVETAPDGIVTCNARGEIESCNRAGEIILGYESLEILGKNLHALWPELIEGVGSPAGALKEHSLGGRLDTRRREVTIQKKNGDPVPLSVDIGETLFDSGRNITVIFHDITRRKDDEARLLAALEDAYKEKSKSLAIIESLSDALIVTDEECRVVLLNPAMEILFGKKAFDVTGRCAEEVFGAGPVAAYFGDIAKKNKQGVSEDILLKGGGGASDIYLKVSSRPIPGASEKEGFRGFVTLFRDVSPERILAQEKSHFVSVAAHELNTPLATIIGYADLLLQAEDYGGFSSTQRNEFLEEISQKSQSLSKIVDDLLDVSRIENGKGISLALTPNDLNVRIARVFKRFANLSPKHRMLLSLPKTMPAVLSDPDKIEEVMENLLSNAVKYSPKGGCVRVEGVIRDGQYVVTVSDEGIGMSVEQVERIFDKFYRADSSNTAVGGLGLGMAIVKAIIEGHAGEIQVESQLGVGTRISFSLPIDSPVL